MNTNDIRKELRKELKDDLNKAVSGLKDTNPAYWLAGGAIVAAGAAWAYSRYRRKQLEKKAINPTTVAHVDVSRYMGRWFEIARIPYKYEKNCTDVQAFYTLEKNGHVRMENYCLKNGKVDIARGSARVVDKNSNAKLKVSFFWPFEGDYWVLGLGENYEWAVVGGPTGDYLWILSRSPQLDNWVRDRILALARDKGYDMNRLEFTPQEASNISKVIEREREDGNTYYNTSGVSGQPQYGSEMKPETQPKVLYPDIE